MKGKLTILPFQLIEMDDKIVIRRGLTSIAIPDKSALVIIRVIQKALLQGPKTTEELTGLFTGSIKNLIENFIEYLAQRQFIISDDERDFYPPNYQETPQDIFYWHFNKSQDQISKILNEKPWAFVGINEINKKLIQSLLSEGKTDFVVVDDPSLRNVSFFSEIFEITDDFWKDERLVIIQEDDFLEKSQDVGFIVGASEFGSFYLLENWNRYAVENAIPFYPLILQNMVGYAGPLVLADEGACLECLKLRQNSASQSFQEKRLTEKFAFEGQQIAAYHNSMLNILAQVGAFDLVKFKSNIQWEISTFCEVDLLGGSMTRRKIVRAPRCAVCSRLKDIPLINIQRQLTSDESWQEIEQTVGYNE